VALHDGHRNVSGAIGARRSLLNNRQAVPGSIMGLGEGRFWVWDMWVFEIDNRPAVLIVNASITKQVAYLAVMLSSP
jgi:hypothetical protein